MLNYGRNRKIEHKIAWYKAVLLLSAIGAFNFLISLFCYSFRIIWGKGFPFFHSHKDLRLFLFPDGHSIPSDLFYKSLDLKVVMFIT